MKIKPSLLLPFLLLLHTNTFGAAMPDYAFEKVANHTWVIHGPLDPPNVENHGFMNNPGAVITNDGVVIVDPGSSLQAGEMVLRALKKITSLPVKAIFNTHIHGDHWLGNQAIKAIYPDVVIYAHPEMLKEIQDGGGQIWVDMMDRMTKGATKGTTVVGPTKACKHGDNITIGGFDFLIHNYGQAHTSTDIMIEVKKESVVFLGDNVLFERLPMNLVESNFKGSISTIDKILKTRSKIWVPGHGKTGDTSKVINYKNFISTVYDTAKKAFNNDLDSSDVKPLLLKATTEYKNLIGYESEIGRHGVQAYMEVEASEF